MTVKTATPEPTAPQISFLTDLIKSRDTRKLSAAGMKVLNDLAWGQASRSQVSATIDELKTLPKKAVVLAAPASPASAPAAPAAPLTEGIYVVPADGSILKLKKSKAGNLYCLAMQDISGKRLTVEGEIVKWDWAYAPGLIKHVEPAWKMTAEIGEALSIKTGNCLWCGHSIWAADTVKKGIGPVCAKKYFA